MQWAVSPPPSEGAARKHPLSGYPRAAVWRQLHHSFATEPELPTPVLAPNGSASEDIAICGRLIDAFSRAARSSGSIFLSRIGPTRACGSK